MVASKEEQLEVSTTRFEDCWSVPGRFRSRNSPNQELRRCCFAFAFVGVQLESLCYSVLNRSTSETVKTNSAPHDVSSLTSTAKEWIGN